MSHLCAGYVCENYKTSYHWPCCSYYCYQNYKQDKDKLFEKQKCPSCSKSAEADQEAWPFCSKTCKITYLELDKPYVPIDRTNVCSLCLFTEVTPHHEECVVLCDDCAGLTVYTCSCCSITFKARHNVLYCEHCIEKSRQPSHSDSDESEGRSKSGFKIANAISSFVQATSQRFLNK